MHRKGAPPGSATMDGRLGHCPFTTLGLSPQKCNEMVLFHVDWCSPSFQHYHLGSTTLKSTAATRVFPISLIGSSHWLVPKQALSLCCDLFKLVLFRLLSATVKYPVSPVPLVAVCVASLISSSLCHLHSVQLRWEGNRNLPAVGRTILSFIGDLKGS